MIARLPRFARGAALAVVTVVLVTTLASMSIALLPGDPARAILGPKNATPAGISAVRHELGLDEPLPQRYVRWAGKAVRGDLGTSYVTHESVSGQIADRLPVTFELMVISQLIALALAIPLAMIAAARAGRAVDHAVSAAGLALLSVPNFVIGVALIAIVAVQLGWLPATGFVPFADDPLENLRTMLLPSISLAAGSIGVYQRVLRRDLVATLGEDFVTLARAKGLAPRLVFVRHALRPSSLSLITITGLNVAGLMGGAVVIETLFALPGLGRLLVDAISARDYVMVQGLTVFIAVTYLVINALVDVAYGLIDPRTRRRGVQTA
jgi:peptide/nickel transport system permease protein